MRGMHQHVLHHGSSWATRVLGLAHALLCACTSWFASSSYMCL